MLTLIPIRAFAGNYLWLMHDGKRALVVNPGDPAPVSRYLQEHALQLESILVTHHHADHTAGVDELREATGAKVYGPAAEHIQQPYVPLREGDSVTATGLAFQVLEVPGHTLGQIAFYTPAMNNHPLLFCGDTLYSGGCGGLFEGTPAQILASLDKLATLPGNTRVCCTHGYTLSNLRFALAEYHTPYTRLREHDQPTLPTSIAPELLINPLLRTRQAAVKTAALHFDAAAHDDTSVFAAIRQRKNQFK